MKDWTLILLVLEKLCQSNVDVPLWVVEGGQGNLPGPLNKKKKNHYYYYYFLIPDSKNIVHIYDLINDHIHL